MFHTQSTTLVFAALQSAEAAVGGVIGISATSTMGLHLYNGNMAGSVRPHWMPPFDVTDSRRLLCLRLATHQQKTRKMHQKNKKTKMNPEIAGRPSFLTADFLTRYSRSSTGETHHITDGSVPPTGPSEPLAVSQRGQYQKLGTGTPERTAVIINVISHTCAFPSVACQNVCSEYGLQTPLRVDILNCHTLAQGL